MKRTVKIFAVILTLALALGVLAVLAGAAVSPVVSKSQNFTNVAATSGNSTADLNNGGWASAIKGRNGTYSVKSDPWQTDNKYFEFNYANSADGVASGSYIYSYIDSSCSLPISTHSYDVFDFDFRSPTGTFGDASSAGFIFKYKNSAGTFGFMSGYSAPSLQFREDSAGNDYLQISGGSEQVSFDSTVWNHLTLLLATEGTDEEGYYVVNFYVYLNGALIFTVEDILPKNVTDFYDGDKGNVGVQDARITFTNTNDGTETLALDNLSVRSYNKEYSADAGCNLGEVIAQGLSITEWSDGVYTSGYEMPYLPAAEVGGEFYGTVEAALATAASGDTVTLLHNANTVTVNKAVILDTNGYAVGNIVADSLNYTLADGVYTFTRLAYDKTQNFDSIGANDYPDASASDANDVNIGNGYSLIYANRHGNPDILAGLNRDGTSNYYLKFKYGATTLGPYITAGTAAQPSTSNYQSLLYSLETMSYHVVDFDVYVPEQALPSAAPITYVVRYLNAAGSATTCIGPTIYIGYDSATGQNWVSVWSTGGGSETVYLSPTSWAHVTGVLDADVSTTDTGVTVTYSLHLYVNGEYVGTRTESATLATSALYGGKLYANLSEIRYNFTSKDSCGDAAIAYDNLGVRGFLAGYEGDTNLDEIISAKSSILEWDGDVTDLDGMPYGATVATVGGVAYDSLAAAVQAAAAGETVTLAASTTESVTVDKAITITTGDYTMGALYTVGDLVAKVTDTGYSVVAVEDADLSFIYYAGGEKTYAGSGTMTFAEVIAAADAGSTVTFMRDYTETSSLNDAIVTINKAITIDLNGYSFNMRTVPTSSSAPAQTRICIGASGNVTVKNGTLTAGYTTENVTGNSEYRRAYPLFQFSAAGGTLSLVEVDTYLASLVYCWDNTGSVYVNVEGGNHYSHLMTYGAENAYFVTRASMVVTAKDATFYLSSPSGGGLVSSKHNRRTAIASSYTFTNCDIIADAVSRSVITVSDSDTTVTFNACNVFGSFNPTDGNTAGYNSGTGLGSLVLGAGTAISSSATVASDYVSTVDGYYQKSVGTTLSLTLDIPSGYYYNGTFTITETAKTYSFDILVSKNEVPVTVSWYDHNGNLIGTTSVYSGQAATVPDGVTYATAVQDGWYRIRYDAWATEAGGAAVSDFVVNEDASFYQVAGEPTPYLTAASYNLGLMGHVQVNLMLPRASEIPEYVTLVGVYTSLANLENGTATGGSSITLNDVSCVRYTIGYKGAVSIADQIVVYVKYIVTLDGTEHTLTQKITVSPLRYCETVLEDSELASPAHSAAAHSVVANMVRYSYTLMQTAGTTNTAVESLYNRYSSKCDAIDEADESEFSSVETDVGALADYIYSITFELSSYEPRYKIVFKDGTTVTDVKFGCLGYIGAVTTKYGETNFGRLSYGYNKNYATYWFDDQGQLINNSGVVVDENGSAVSGATAGTKSSYIGVTHSQNIPIYNIDTEMTITLTLADGSTVSGEYSLNAYYNGVKDEVDTDTLAVVRTFLKSLRTYGESVIRYRFPIGRYPYVDLEAGTISTAAFGAVGDGVTNDFAALKKVHDYANANGLKVVGVSGANYYIGTTDGQTITIKTDVDWTGVTFSIDDSIITTSTEGRTTPIFTVASDYSKTTITENLPASLSAGATKLDLGLGYKALVLVKNSNVTHFIRAGSNTGSAPQQEILLLDENGNIDSSTPVQWDFTTITSIDVYRADDNPVTITGGTMINKANTADRAYDYYHRGLRVQRSNTTVDGMTQRITDEGASGAPYTGSLQVAYCNNVAVKNTEFQAHKAYALASDSSTTMGSYALNMNYSANVTCYNLTQSNFFASDGSLTVDGTSETGDGSGTRCWGAMSSNFCKGLVYDTCTLSRFDAHQGVLGATIKNSTVAHVTLIGAGDFTIRNSVMYVGKRGTALTLRADYGSTWNGDFRIEGLTLKYDSNTSYTGIDLIYAYQYEDHYFGYNTYLPTNIYIDSLSTLAYTRTDATSETTGDANAMDIGIYVNLNNSMTDGVEYTTSNDGNLDPKTCTTAIYVTNCSGLIDSAADITLPDHAFFSNMKLYIGGGEVEWTGTDTSKFGSSSDSSGCLVEGTLVNMADGSLKPVEQLEIGDEILVFNHETGEYEAGRLWFTVHGDLPADNHTVLRLAFSDGTSLGIVHEHALFDSTLAKYVYLSVENAADYVGHEFLTTAGTVTLEGYTVTEEYVKVYSPISEMHLNVVAEGILTATTSLFDLNEMINAYEYEADGRYNAEAREADLALYGEYTYDEFSHLFSEDEFNGSPLRYLKVAVEKGLITRENIEALIKACVALGYMEAPQ